MSGRLSLEIGAGEHPDPSYQVHTDLLPLPGIEVVCAMDELPFADGSFSALRANHVLEHQSWQLVEATLMEWARVLTPGATVDIGVPDARFVAKQWIAGDIDTFEANHWLLGGHAEREPHRGRDARGVPLWVWNAHHTLFDAASLTHLLETCGFEQIEIECYAMRNLRCRCRRAAQAGASQARPLRTA